MDARVSQITLVVSNQQTALEFYTRKIGFEKKTDYTPSASHRWVTVGPLGQDIEIALIEQSGNAQGANKLPIVLRVSDCRKAFTELKSRGVEFTQPQPEEVPWGIVATFSDPDGNMFSIYQAPPADKWK